MRRPIDLAKLCAALPALLLSTCLTGCLLDAEDAIVRLDQRLAAIARDEVHGAVMWVDAPRHGIQRGFGHGLSDEATRVEMTVETPFFSASVGKLFVAAAILSLVHDGKLSLDDPVTRHIARSELAGLPIVGGDAALDAITIRMLLSHRSGLPDYFSDASKDGSPRLFDGIVDEHDRAWTRRDLLNYARDHYAAAGAPGESFHYADTNYDLLGMVLEGVTGRPFHEVVRERVIAPIGLRHTWYHAFEPAPLGASAPADVWIRGVNLRGARSLSADQAGGGLVTTLADLRDFMRAMVDGRPIPLSALTTGFSEDAMHEGIDVGLGAWRIRPSRITILLTGMPELFGHSGATGVWLYYVPDWDAVLVGSVSDARWEQRHVEFVLSDVVPVLARTRQTTASPGP